MQQHTTLKRTISLKKATALVLAFALTLSLSPLPGHGQAYADTAAEKQAEAEAALASLNSMQDTLDRLSAEYGEALAAQEEAEANRDAAEQRIGEIEEQIDDLQGRLGERAREMYRSGGISFIEILLGARSFEEFATSLDMVNRVNENDANMVQERKDLKEEAEEQHQIYTEQADLAAQKSQEAAEAEEQAASTVAEMAQTYESLSAEAAQLLEEERAAQEAAEAARAQAVIEAAVAAAEDGGGSGGGDYAASSYDGGSTATSTSGGGGSAAPSYSYEGGSDTVSRAYACLGAPYVWGGVGPAGYDCSGLVSYCLTGSHTRLGTTYTFMNWPRVSDPQPGDICVNSGHTGIYIGNGQMIHAATYGVGVIIGPVQSGMIIVRWAG